jgi:hypothetical protein
MLSATVREQSNKNWGSALWHDWKTQKQTKKLRSVADDKRETQAIKKARNRKVLLLFRVLEDVCRQSTINRDEVGMERGKGSGATATRKGGESQINAIYKNTRCAAMKEKWNSPTNQNTGEQKGEHKWKKTNKLTGVFDNVIPSQSDDPPSNVPLFFSSLCECVYRNLCTDVKDENKGKSFLQPTVLKHAPRERGPGKHGKRTRYSIPLHSRRCRRTPL